MIGYLLFSAIKREVTKGVKKGSVQVLTADVSQPTVVLHRPADMETNSKETLQADFDVFDISEEFGFLLEEPLVGFNLIFSLLMMQCSHLRRILFCHILDKSRRFETEG